jgi:hypothetical protein
VFKKIRNKEKVKMSTVQQRLCVSPFLTPNCISEDNGKIRLQGCGIISGVLIFLPLFSTMCNKRKMAA